ncbi:MAG: prepilin-type N-terminal cleavage/methylation domain-containing protein [bacterium]|nr:prepilin-type N-terminal cleavage/methylation domain-containing protein [bacterium]
MKVMKDKGFTRTNLRTNLSGFTLIELLVVITIMAILIIISISTFSSFQKGARDDKRRSDLGVIQSLLQQYYSDQGFFPALAPAPNPLTFGSSLTNCTGNPNINPCSSPNPTKNYSSKLPVDLTATTPFLYHPYASLSPQTECDNTSATTKCVIYCLYAKMEKTSDKQDTACPNTYDPTVDGYEVISP